MRMPEHAIAFRLIIEFAITRVMKVFFEAETIASLCIFDASPRLHPRCRRARFRQGWPAPTHAR
jgi:hypothetical protein